MATWADKIDTQARHAARESRQVQLSRVLVVVVCGFFYLLGWLPGCAWRVLAVCALMIRQGWREGTGTAAAAAQPDAPS